MSKISPGYDPHNKGLAAQHIMEHEGMLTGLIYENDRQSYEQASGLAAANTIKNVEKMPRANFEKLLEGFK